MYPVSLFSQVPAPERINRVIRATIVLVALGLVATFPPLWDLL